MARDYIYQNTHDHSNLNNFISMLFFVFINFDALITLSQIYDFGMGGQIMVWMFLVFSIVCVILKYLFYSKVHRNSFFIMVLLLALGMLSLAFSGETFILKLVAFILIAKELSKKQALKYNNFSLILAFSLILMTALIGITDLHFWEGTKEAYRLGFRNPNSPPVIIFAIIAGYNLYHYINFKIIVLESIILGITFYLCQSRTAGIVYIVYIFALLIIKIMKDLRVFRFLMKPWQYLFVFCAFISCYAAYQYSATDSMWIEANLLFSGRFFAWQSYILQYGINLFGSKVDFTLFGALDNGYLQLLVRYGIIVFLLYSFIFIYISRYAYKCRDWVLLVTIISYEVYFFCEFTPMAMNFCPPLILLAYILMNWDIHNNEISQLSKKGDI